MNGKEELKEVLRHAITAVDDNRCRIPESMFHVMAVCMREVMVFLRQKKELSRREVARMLNTTERNLYRLMAKKILPKPHRNGDRNVLWYADEIEGLTQKQDIL